METFEIETLVGDPESVRILVMLINRWIRQRCRKKGLTFDSRSKSYFFKRNPDNEDPIAVQWKPRLKQSERELTKPMKRGEITIDIERQVNYGNY